MLIKTYVKTKILIERKNIYFEIQYLTVAAVTIVTKISSFFYLFCDSGKFFQKCMQLFQDKEI